MKFVIGDTVVIRAIDSSDSWVRQHDKEPSKIIQRDRGFFKVKIYSNDDTCWCHEVEMLAASKNGWTA